jgi:hypothetical protein
MTDGRLASVPGVATPMSVAAALPLGDAPGAPGGPDGASIADARGLRWDVAAVQGALVDEAQAGQGDGPRPRRRQRAARRPNRSMTARWLSAIRTELMEEAHSSILQRGRVEPATWSFIEGVTVDLMRAAGFNVPLEAQQSVVAALARNELLGLSGGTTTRAVRTAEAAFGRTVERMLNSAVLQAFDAARAAGDRDPGRVDAVIIPWLLRNVGFVRRMGTLAASRALLLLRQNGRDDLGPYLGPGFLYEILAGGGELALFGADGERLQCNLSAGDVIVGWPMGAQVWVYLRRAPRGGRTPAPPTPSVCGTADLAPYRTDLLSVRAGGRCRGTPQAYMPICHDGRQQLAVLRAAEWCIVGVSDVLGDVAWLEDVDLGDVDPYDYWPDSDPGSPSESDEESDEEAGEGSDGEGWPGEGDDGDDPLRVQRLYGGGGDGPWRRDLSRASPRRGARGEPSRRKRKTERTAVRAAKRAALGGVHPADERAADERGAREAAALGGEERGREAAAGRGREAAGEERGCEAAAVRGREAAPAVRDREVVAATTPHHEAAAGHGHEAAASEDAARLARFLELATDCRLCGTPFLTEYLGAFPLCPGCRRVARRASVAPPRPPPAPPPPPPGPRCYTRAPSPAQPPAPAPAPAAPAPPLPGLQAPDGGQREAGAARGRGSRVGFSGAEVSQYVVPREEAAVKSQRYREIMAARPAKRVRPAKRAAAKDAAEATKAAAPNVAAKAAGARRASVRVTGSAGSSALSAGLEGA